MTDLTIEQRVANGAAYLDKILPDWLDQIDLAVFDVASPCNCVLGQVYGNFDDSPIDARWRLGQYAADDRGFNGADEDLPELTDEWRRVITSCREVTSDAR